MIRLFDLFSSTLGLILLSPLFLVVAAAIKAGDGGPVFFKQERVGRNGRPFKILKFRTMVTGSDKSGLPITVGGDSRVTAVGGWLRKWKLDELPQLINVIQGEMGLVGPRPELPRYVALYTKEQAEVLSLRPGVTDAASITYRNENEVLSRSEDPEAFYIQNIMPNKIRINLQYSVHATVLNNLKIILATLGVLSPPVRVRQAGDLRAFDRMLFEAPTALSISDLPGSEVLPVNISIGGILLKPHPEVPSGGLCRLTIRPEGPRENEILLEGRILRSDDQGVAIRFSRPLEEETCRALKIRPEQ